MKGNIKKEKNMEKENLIGLMDLIILGILSTIISMEKVKNL
jgi:hypothetical protein